MKYEIIDAKQALVNYLTQDKSDIFVVIDADEKYVIDIIDVDIEAVKVRPDSYIVITQKIEK